MAIGVPPNPADPSGQQSKPQLKGSPDQGPEESPEVSYELVVSEDKLKASLCAHGEGASSISMEGVKKFLKAKGICHDLVDDRQIEEYVSQGAILKEPCLMAEGQPATLGKDAQVTYYFDRDPLKIGGIRAGGAIDFKDKGEIPQVKEGDLLGEKIPLIKEKPGMDVFGKPIPVEPAKDVLFHSGTGTKKSPDGLKIYAQINGRPELMGDGSVCVFPEIRIKGDVGLATGHIRFDGFVDVEGTIQEGFQVKAGRLAAKERGGWRHCGGWRHPRRKNLHQGEFKNQIHPFLPNNRSGGCDCGEGGDRFKDRNEWSPYRHPSGENLYLPGRRQKRGFGQPDWV
jgi:hypothetical protein